MWWDIEEIESTPTRSSNLPFQSTILTFITFTILFGYLIIG
jgi:hypothetical protein